MFVLPSFRYSVIPLFRHTILNNKLCEAQPRKRGAIAPRISSSIYTKVKMKDKTFASIAAK